MAVSGTRYDHPKRVESPPNWLYPHGTDHTKSYGAILIDVRDERRAKDANQRVCRPGKVLCGGLDGSGAPCGRFLEGAILMELQEAFPPVLGDRNVSQTPPSVFHPQFLAPTMSLLGP